MELRWLADIVLMAITGVIVGTITWAVAKSKYRR